MDPRKGVRRTTLAVLLLLLVTVPIVMGFVLAQDSHDVIAVDLRGTPAAKDLDDWANRIKNSADSVIAVTDTSQFDTESCAATDKRSSCVIGSRITSSLFRAPGVKMSDVLREQYGVDIPPDTAYWQGTVTTSTGFDGLAALVSFVVIGALGAAAYGALLRKTPAPQPVVPQPVTPYRQYHPPQQPQRQLAEVTAGPPRHQPAVTATQSVPPARAIAPELRSLVTQAHGKAVARTHVTGAGGYVAVGGTVVWAILRPSDEAVVVPEDRLDVLAVDEESEALVVAPTSTERGPRP